MNTRTRTIASFFSVAMAAMLLGAVVTTQMRPQPALARSADPAAAAAIPARPLGPPTLETFRDIAHGATPGVVNINTKKLVKGQRNPFRDFFGDDMLDRFFGPQGPQGQGQGRGPEMEAQRSLGSGFVVDKDGYILTNRHVIEGADQISVTLASGRTYDAKLVGKDARTDVALIKIEPKEPLTILNLGNSDQADVGEWVMAIGNPFGLWADGQVGGPSVTVGVVSYKGRGLTLGVRGTAVDMIQTDASINPGNSGGPLLNTRGEVIGINTMIITNGPQQSSGVGFAVPINVAKEILPQLRTRGRVIRGWLGVNIQSVTEALARTYHMKEAKGALISDVTEGSPAEKAGLRPDDIVVAVDGREVRDNSDLTSYIASRAPDTTVHLKVMRAGSDLGTFPEEGVARESRSESEGRSHQGMTLQNLTPELAAELQLPRSFKGVVVTQVEAGSNAEDAGLQRGDVIVSINGENVDDVHEVEKELVKAKSDGVARVRFRRGNLYTFTTLKLD
ncbi:MAG: peptidase [Acidobacteria bacterium]|nr:MAG: peptidase [Acidobacteriota bacterium]